LEVITSRDSGLILYFGPLDDDQSTEDFLLLELEGGYPVLRVNQLSGEARLSVDELHYLVLESEGGYPVLRVNQGSGEAQ